MPDGAFYCNLFTHSSRSHTNNGAIIVVVVGAGWIQVPSTVVCTVIIRKCLLAVGRICGSQGNPRATGASYGSLHFQPSWLSPNNGAIVVTGGVYVLLEPSIVIYTIIIQDRILVLGRTGGNLRHVQGVGIFSCVLGSLPPGLDTHTGVYWPLRKDDSYSGPERPEYE